ncbi:lipase 3-like [Epargyreus clarus]|uniref:lipase 3-like n=1 Tax=Epargyreus clarus TaxID=520877 RepID=UPI003C3084CB
MKTLIVLLLVIFCHTHNVTTNHLFEMVGEKIKDFADSFMLALKNIRTKMKRFLNHHFTNEKGVPRTTDRYLIEQKTRRAFSDIVEESTQDSKSDFSELEKYKHEPTALMTTPQLAKHHGKIIETHVVITGDGYLLTIHRIMRPLDQPLADKIINPTVLLHHGLLGSSADWILLGPENSLPYILSNLGYDVWMTNARGNCYSRGHASKNVDSLQYWKFSFQEMGKYDLPAVVDYIRMLKNSNDSINFIGHSMGATALLVLLSTTPRYNKYFRMGILLAPLAYMSNIEGPLRIFTPMAMNLPEDLLKLLGDGEFFPSRKIPTWVVKKYCKGELLYCSNPLLFLSNIPSIGSWNTSLVARVLYHVPAGGSTNTILHYARLVRTGKFQRFDDVAEFPLKKVTLPIALFTSSDDCLATIPDVLKLYFSIANPIDHYIIRGKNFSHNEFVFGPQANMLVFDKVVNILERGLNENVVKLNEV